MFLKSFSQSDRSRVQCPLTAESLEPYGGSERLVSDAISRSITR